MTDQTESEYAELLRSLDRADRIYGDGLSRKAAAAIRALEAKVLLLEQHIGLLKAENAHYLIGRDRLAGEVERLERVRSEQEQFCNAMVIERDIFKNAMDASMRTEVRLTSELAAAREDAERLTKLAYDWKRKAEYLDKDRARLVLMNESLGDALDAARRSGEGEA